MTEQLMAYIARCKCGNVVGAAVDLPEYAKDNAKEVARWIADGLTVDRVSIEEARLQFGSCTCEVKRD